MDGDDVVQVASRWRCCNGDDCYDERYDLNGDGVINIVDITLVSRDWGDACCVLFGDLDGDGDVDVDDIGLVASRWRTSCENPDPDNDPDTPNYEARYDVNGDCIIDIVDITLVSAHLGDTCE